VLLVEKASVEGAPQILQTNLSYPEQVNDLLQANRQLVAQFAAALQREEQSNLRIIELEPDRVVAIR
jgi:hypothetical protein